MNFNRKFSDVFHTLRSLIVGCGRHPRCFDWYDFGQSTWQVLFTNVKIMLRRYILSLGSREIAKCQKRLMSLDAVAPIGTAIEKDANYKVKNTCISNFLKLLWCRHCRVECAIVVCLNWLCNNNRPNIKNPIRLDLQSEWFKAICWELENISMHSLIDFDLCQLHYILNLNVWFCRKMQRRCRFLWMTWN